MPRPRDWPPTLRHHKGYARVQWGGRWYHLGRSGSAEANAAFSRLSNLWRIDPYHEPEDVAAITVQELCQGYLAARPYPEGRHQQYKRAIVLFSAAHLDVTVPEFGPLMLAAWQRGLIETVDGKGRPIYTREYVGMLVRIIRGVWRWGVRTERVDVAKWQALLTVPGLRAGQGKPGRKVAAVDDGDLAKILPHLPRAARGLLMLLRLTGARPSELAGLKPADIVRSGNDWTYTPASHKTAAKGKERVIYFGPRARAVLGEFEGDGPYFVHSRGKTYNSTALLHAVKRACKRAGVEPITVYQLRHSRLAEVRASVGAEGAQAVGGHERLSTMEFYTSRRNDLAAKVALESG